MITYSGAWAKVAMQVVQRRVEERIIEHTLVRWSLCARSECLVPPRFMYCIRWRNAGVLLCTCAVDATVLTHLAAVWHRAFSFRKQ